MPGRRRRARNRNQGQEVPAATDEGEEKPHSEQSSGSNLRESASICG